MTLTRLGWCLVERMRSEPYVTFRQGYDKAVRCGWGVQGRGRGYPAGHRPACHAYVSNLHLQGKLSERCEIATMATMATPKSKP